MKRTTPLMAKLGCTTVVIGLLSSGTMAETFVYDYSNVLDASPFPGDRVGYSRRMRQAELANQEGDMMCSRHRDACPGRRLDGPRKDLPPH